MKPHQERVLTERRELDEKRKRLTLFIAGETFRGLDHEEQQLLLKQLACMDLYSTTLGERIALWGRGTP